METIVIGFQSGDVWVLKYDEQKLICLLAGNREEHDGDLTCLTVLPESGFILSGSKDKVVKIRNTRK